MIVLNNGSNVLASQWRQTNDDDVFLIGFFDSIVERSEE